MTQVGEPLEAKMRMFDEPDLARPRSGHPGWQQCQGPVRLPDHQVFDASMALDTNNYDEFTASRMERISNPLLARQTPGIMTLVRPALEKRICASASPRPSFVPVRRHASLTWSTSSTSRSRRKPPGAPAASPRNCYATTSSPSIHVESAVMWSRPMKLVFDAACHASDST